MARRACGDVADGEIVWIKCQKLHWCKFEWDPMFWSQYAHNCFGCSIRQQCFYGRLDFNMFVFVSILGHGLCHLGILWKPLIHAILFAVMNKSGDFPGAILHKKHQFDLNKLRSKLVQNQNPYDHYRTNIAVLQWTIVSLVWQQPTERQRHDIPNTARVENQVPNIFCFWIVPLVVKCTNQGRNKFAKFD